MEESFELLSSMSPKISSKRVEKFQKKGPSVLSLKKHFRKSLELDNRYISIKYEASLINISSESSSFVSANSVVDSLNKSPIIISDSDNSDVENGLNERFVQANNKVVLPISQQTKVDNWLEQVNAFKEIPSNMSLFSEISEIKADLCLNKTDENQKIVANSTFKYEEHQFRFDELFKNNLEVHAEDIEPDEPLTKNCLVENKKNVDGKSKKRVTTKKSKSQFQSLNSCNNLDDDYKSNAALLDELYGEEWREKQDQILPKSEPRNRLNRPEIKDKTSKTEKKKKQDFSIVNAKAGGLLRTLHTAQIKAALESPQVPNLLYTNNREVDDCESPSLHNDSPASDQIKNKKQNVTERRKNSPLLPINLFNVDNNCSPDIEVKTKKKLRKLSSSSESDSNSTSDQMSDENINELERIYNKYLGVDLELNNLPKSVLKSNSKTASRKSVKPPISNDTEKSSTKSCDVGKKQEGGIKKIDKENKSKTKKSSKLTNETDKKPQSSNQKFSFLASLTASVQIDLCDNSARLFRENYKAYKEQLAQKLFKLFNETIFDLKIPEDTQLEWNDRMRKTAGMCYCKKITRRTGVVERKVRIVLATKIVDSAARLRDTLVHEMCHAATWIVNEVSDGHGPFWKSWAQKAMNMYPELPRIERCHNYEINTKYTYRCTQCGYSIGRHSKSLNVERKRCGICYGEFEVLINKTTKTGEIKTVVATPKKPNEFALFVKENYSEVKTAEMKHGDVMKILGKKFTKLNIKT